MLEPRCGAGCSTIGSVLLCQTTLGDKLLLYFVSRKCYPLLAAALRNLGFSLWRLPITYEALRHTQSGERPLNACLLRGDGRAFNGVHLWYENASIHAWNPAIFKLSSFGRH